jgi:hypothetical protein
MHNEPEIIATPRGSDFAEHAGRIAARIPSGLGDVEALNWYRRELREHYPHAIVREQDDLARTRSSSFPVWYTSNRPRPFRIDIALDVPLDRQAAFSVYTDRVVEWQTAVELVPRTPVATSLVRREYDACYSFLGLHYTGSYRVRAADPPASVTYEASGSGISVWYTAQFEQLTHGTRVAITGDYDLPDTFLARIADRLVLERAVARDIARANDTYLALCSKVARELGAAAAP